MVAAIDVGTNTTRLLVARITDGVQSPIAHGSTMTALGEGVGATGRIRADALEFAEHTVAAMAREARELGAGRMVVACTAVARNAANADELLNALQRATGVRPRVLSGEEEAGLTFRGLMTTGMPDRFVAADLGGGSLELMGGDGGTLEWVTSLPIGVRSMTERHRPGDPPALDVTGPMVDEALEQVGPVAQLHPATAVVATGGSASALATLAGTDRLDRAGLLHAAERLAGAAAADIAAETGLEPARIRMCLAGAAVLEAVRRAFDVEALQVSQAGIREGLVAETV